MKIYNFEKTIPEEVPNKINKSILKNVCRKKTKHVKKIKVNIYQTLLVV